LDGHTNVRKRGLVELNPDNLSRSNIAGELQLEDTQRALTNILDDIDTEKNQLEQTQKATINILEDFNEEKLRLENTQRALLNILDDFDIEKTKVEQTNLMLQAKSDELNRANEELQRARDTLEIRVQERTAELQQRTLELETSNKELESFSYSISHDLRAPLRSMDGFSLALMEDYGDKLDATAKEYLQFIRSSSQLMGQLIDDILNLSRITRAEVHLNKVDLSELANEVVDDLKRLNPERRVYFIINSQLEGYGDRNLLKLVLQNLLGNAFKFTGKQPEARIEFGTTYCNGEMAYFVRDNGVGFDMAYANKLFKPFQRLHRPEEFSGTGIGLASVQRIISRLGGRVWAEGKEGRGAVFYFTLPKPRR
jgi:light-regulated signal transduction histidine kinase (bacteriophytochrome)